MRGGQEMATNLRSSWQLLVVLLRLYLGWSWLTAGWEKVWDPAWRGRPAVAGFLTAALKTTHFGWYRWVIEAVFLPNANAWPRS
jgi:thiosulfate dehydrogenase [quinone] large subunit